MNRALVTSKLVTKDLTFVSLESQKERKKCGAENNIWRNDNRNFCKFWKRCKLTEQEAEQKISKVNKEFHTHTYHNQISENLREKKKKERGRWHTT